MKDLSSETEKLWGKKAQRLYELSTFEDMTQKRVVRQRIEQVVSKKLTELDLSGLDLKELPPEIVNCTHLTQLLLSKNQITQLPEALGQLSNLTELNRA
jgi:Leucine-rich repeat (LRR) protein